MAKQVILKKIERQATSTSFHVPKGGNAALADAVIRNSQREHAEIAVANIVPNPRQPRMTFDQTKLMELAESIKQDGLIEEIVVRESPTQESIFEIICGERRYKACSELLGWMHIPATIRVATDAEMLRIAIIENEQRQQLSALELAAGYKQLYEMRDSTGEREHSIRSLAAELGKNKDHVLQHLKIVDAPPSLKQLLIDDPTISLRIVCELMDVEDAGDQAYLLEGVRAHRYTNEDMMALVRDLKKQRVASVVQTELSTQQPPQTLLPTEQPVQVVPSNRPFEEEKMLLSNDAPNGTNAPENTFLPAKITIVEEHPRVIRPSLELALAERKRTLVKDGLQIEKIVKRYQDDHSSMSEQEQLAVQEKVRQWVGTLQSLLELSHS